MKKILIFAAFAKLVFFLTAAIWVSTANGQIPGQLKNLPAFKMRSLILSSLKKLNSSGRLNDFKSSNNAPCLKKQITLGGTGNDFGSRLKQTHDGGFIVCGGTNSADGDFNVPVTNGEDGFIAKYDKFRHLEWTKTAGGTGDDFFNDVAQTSDGGYIVAANTSSTDGDVTGNHGVLDMWVVKFGAKGNIQWQKCLGGSGVELGEAVVETRSGDYAVTGFANSTDGDVSGIHGDFDAWLVQLSPKGNLLSQHCYGGTAFDDFIAIVRSDTGNLILQGATQSNDGDVSGNHGGTDSWAVKINPSGKIIWETTFGDTTEDNSSPNIAKTTDGNIVMDGYSYVPSGIVGPKDSLFSFQTKLNAHTGNIIWSKNYHNPAERGGFGVFATTDGGTVETGTISNSIFDNSTHDVLISKFDTHGKKEWYKTLGGSDFDGGLDGGFEDKNGNLNILCQTASTDGDVKNNHGGVDTWLIKLGHCGDTDVDDDEISSKPIASDIKNNTALLSVYPNPVSGSAIISFSLLQPKKVVINIYDMNGRLMKTLANEQMQAGTHQLNWHATDERGSPVVAGIYLLKLNAGNYIETKKISVIK